MTRGQYANLLLLAGAIAALYIAAAGMLVAAAVDRLRRPPPQRSRAYIWLRRAVWTLSGLGLMLGFYMLAIEPNWLEVNHVRVPCERMNAGARPVRIALIADLHSEAGERLETRVANAIAAEQPDVILFAGDALNEPEGLPVFRDLMSRLAAIAPTFAVRGNWDKWYWSDLELFAGTGVRELDCAGSALDVGPSRLWIVGVPEGGERAIAPLLRRAPEGSLRVLLYHRPDQPEAAAAGRADLYCAGHTHGGQVVLPLHGPLVRAPVRPGTPLAGFHTETGVPIVVTRGVGMEGGIAPRVRLLARPEVTIVEIVPR